MTDSEQQYFEMNRTGWDQRAEVHFGSKFYNVEGFLAGQTSLREIELAELSHVADKTMLHLQCHFGLDTLSWARQGANCTGVDISPVAIKKARELADKTKLDASFVCSDIYSYSREHADPFDIVYMSYGTICWLPDLQRWAKIVAANLISGGTFYIAEFHPVIDLLEGYSYFTPAVPDVEEEATYTENGANTVNKLATWAHPLSSVINALINAGIQIERVNEYPFSPYNSLKGLVEREPGRFYLDHKSNDIPLVYSITGRKR